MRVETARGAMAVDGLGTTLMHEDVFVLTSDVMQNYGHEWRWDEQDRGADAVRQLHGLKDVGVDSIVDPTVVARSATSPPVQRANEQVDINIIVATGLYTFDEIPHLFHYRSPGTILDGPGADDGDVRQRHPARHGGTGVKAGLLKCAIDEHSLTPDVERILRAVGQVAALVKDGYADQMVLTHDASRYSDFYSESYKSALLPRWNYTHITDDVLPRCANTASTRPRSRRCWSTTPPAISPEVRREPNGCYRDFPHAQPLPASGCSG